MGGGFGEEADEGCGGGAFGRDGGEGGEDAGVAVGEAADVEEEAAFLGEEVVGVGVGGDCGEGVWWDGKGDCSGCEGEEKREYDGAGVGLHVDLLFFLSE